MCEPILCLKVKDDILENETSGILSTFGELPRHHQSLLHQKWDDNIYIKQHMRRALQRAMTKTM